MNGRLPANSMNELQTKILLLVLAGCAGSGDIPISGDAHVPTDAHHTDVLLDAQSLDADSSDGGHLDPLPLDAGECRSHLDPVSDRQATEVCDNRYRICLSNAEFCLGTCPDAGPIPPERHCELEHLACCRRGPYDCPRYSVVRELVDNNALYSVLPLCEE